MYLALWKENDIPFKKEFESQMGVQGFCRKRSKEHMNEEYYALQFSENGKLEGKWTYVNGYTYGFEPED